jgi:hypothetical protein
VTGNNCIDLNATEGRASKCPFGFSSDEAEPNIGARIRAKQERVTTLYEVAMSHCKSNTYIISIHLHTSVQIYLLDLHSNETTKNHNSIRGLYKQYICNIDIFVYICTDRSIYICTDAFK